MNFATIKRECTLEQYRIVKIWRAPAISNLAYRIIATMAAFLIKIGLQFWKYAYPIIALMAIFAIKIDLNIVKGKHNLHTRLCIFLSDEEDLIS